MQVRILPGSREGNVMNDPFGIAIGVAVAVALIPVIIQQAIRQYKMTRGRQIVRQQQEQSLIDIYEQHRS